MKKKLVLCGLFGLVGIVGLLLGSKQLMAFFLFFLLFLLAPLKEDADYEARIHKVLRCSLITCLFAFATVFIFSAILGNMPMITQQMRFDIALLILIEALSGCFVLTIAVFAGGCLLAGVRSHIIAAKGQEIPTAPNNKPENFEV